MKRGYIKTGACMLLVGWLLPVHAMQLNNENFLKDKIDIAFSGKTTLYVFPVVPELRLQNNKVDKYWYVLLGKNKSSDAALSITKDMWSGFVIDYSDIKSYWEYARQIGRGVRYAAWEWLMDKEAKPQFVLTSEDVTQATYGLLELFTNDMYTRYDVAEEKNSSGTPISPLKIYIRQDGEGSDQTTDIIVFVTLQVRKSITALDTDGKNKFKDKFLWYPVRSLAQDTDLRQSNVDQKSIELLKKYFKQTH